MSIEPDIIDGPHRVLWRGEVYRYDPFGLFDGGPGESTGVPPITDIDAKVGAKVALVVIDEHGYEDD